MSTPSEIESASRPGQTPAGAADGSWAAALAALVSARIELLRLESHDAARHWGRSAGLLAVAVLAAFVGWLALVAGGVAAVTALSGWPWYLTTLGAAAIHFGVAAVCALVARRTKPPTFPLTRNEFIQDREWLKKLANPRS
jgi:predicted phage tail protein